MLQLALQRCKAMGMSNFHAAVNPSNKHTEASIKVIEANGGTFHEMQNGLRVYLIP